MSDIQRWERWNNTMRLAANGKYVTYADHVEAVKQARDEGYEYGFNSNDTAFMEGYNKGQRDERARLAAVTDEPDSRAGAVYRAGMTDALAAVVQRVEALPILIRYVGMDAVAVSDVIAAIKGEQA